MNWKVGIAILIVGLIIGGISVIGIEKSGKDPYTEFKEWQIQHNKEYSEGYEDGSVFCRSWYFDYNELPSFGIRQSWTCHKLNSYQEGFEQAAWDFANERWGYDEGYALQNYIFETGLGCDANKMWVLTPEQRENATWGKNPFFVKGFEEGAQKAFEENLDMYLNNCSGIKIIYGEGEYPYP